MEKEPMVAQWLDGMRDAGYLPDSRWAQVGVGLLALVVLMALASWLTSRVVTTLARRALLAVGREDWSDALWRRRVFRSISYAVPLLVVAANVSLLPLQAVYVALLSKVFLAAGLIFIFQALSGALRAWQDVYALSQRAQTRSIKGYIELGRIALWAICLVLVVSILVDRSPLLMLSGLGALSAVLLLVFKDTLLSLVASTQMTSNDMLRIGDWIEMPQAGADGFVIDMALHTVKVQNWDKTVTTIPTYKLFSESYRNFRYMFESGGRRIKRSLRIDASSVRFLEEAEIAALSRFALLREYLAGKQRELEESNRALGDSAAVGANRRRLTNLGTFRAYAMAYLAQHKELRQDMLMIVRLMESDSQGVPVEVYCFSANTAWVEFERIQGDIFDHLLAILPELSLRLYQAPSGNDLANAWSGPQAVLSGDQSRASHALAGAPPD